MEQLPVFCVSRQPSSQRRCQVQVWQDVERHMCTSLVTRQKRIRADGVGLAPHLSAWFCVQLQHQLLIQ
jgi:hypothetical protein